MMIMMFFGDVDEDDDYDADNDFDDDNSDADDDYNVLIILGKLIFFVML